MMARSKTVSTIEYTKNGFDLKIPLKLVTTAAGYRNSVPTLEYHVEIDKPVAFKSSGKDPQKLVEELLKALDKVCLLTWEPWLYLETSGVGLDHHDCVTSMGSHLEIKLQYVLIGTNSLGGQQHCFYDGTKRPDLEAFQHRFNYQHTGIPNTGPQTRLSKDDEVGSNRALLRDTPENRAAIQVILDSLDAMATRVAEFLAPSRIESTLKNVAGLLPAPKGSPE